MIIVAESHLDHSVTQQQLAYVLEKFKDKDCFFIETIELPPELGMAPCSLYGPVMGDPPITPDQVAFVQRGDRKYPSRVIAAQPRPTNKITIIAGPFELNPCVLYTIFGGPSTPKEPFDPFLTVNELSDSLAFWREHALAFSW